jgi:4-amino-4-deoxy-L-arabinose transferase-like glycosyltransferase
LLLCAIQLLLGVFYLGSVPRIYVDETIDGSVGYELAETGVLRHPFIRNFGGMEIYFIQPHILLPIVCAGVFKIAGYSIAVSRLPSLLLGVLAAIILYRVAEQFFENKQGLLIGLAAIINTWFWMSSRRCRPEMYYTVLALLFLWLVISYFHRGRAFVAFLAGITAALASLTHPNGLIIIVAISISWIIWKEKPHLLKFVIWALAGFILTILPYVIYVLWATRQPNVSFLGQVQVHMYSSVMAREIMRWRNFFQLPFGIPVGLVMLVSWLAAWWKSTAEDKLIATIVALYLPGLAMLSINALPDYVVVVVPFFSMLVVRFVYRLHEFDFLSGSRRMYYIVGFIVILIYVVSFLPPIVFMLYQQHDADFNKVVDEVAKVVGPKARVYANPVFWVGHDRYIYGPCLITYDTTVMVSEALQWAYSQSFEYAVRTVWILTPPRGFRKLPDRMPEFRSNCVMDSLCRVFGTKVYEFYNEYYGPVEIYKLDWSTMWNYRLRKQDIK